MESRKRQKLTENNDEGSDDEHKIAEEKKLIEDGRHDEDRSPDEHSHKSSDGGRDDDGDADEASDHKQDDLSPKHVSSVNDEPSSEEVRNLGVEGATAAVDETQKVVRSTKEEDCDASTLPMMQSERNPSRHRGEGVCGLTLEDSAAEVSSSGIAAVAGVNQSGEGNSIPTEPFPSKVASSSSVPLSSDAPPPPKRAKRSSKWDSQKPAEEKDELVGGAHQEHVMYALNVPLSKSKAEVFQFLEGALFALSGSDTLLAVEPLQDGKSESVAIDEGATYVIKLKTKMAAQLCVRLNGIRFEGKPIKIAKSPSGGENADDDKLFGLSSDSVGAETIGHSKNHRLHVSNLPLHYSETQVRSILEQFGSLSYFSMCKEPATGLSRGSASFEYNDQEIGTVALQALNGSLCGDQALRVQLASLPGSNTSLAAAAAAAASTLGGTMLPTAAASNVNQRSTSMTKQIFSNPVVGAQVREAREIGDMPSQVVQLLNVVFQEDLTTDEDYNFVVEDMKREASKFGDVQVVIPKPAADLSYKAGVGKVFLHYSDVTAARKARLELNGRRYDTRRVACAAFYPLDKFLEGKYVLS